MVNNKRITNQKLNDLIRHIDQQQLKLNQYEQEIDLLKKDNLNLASTLNHLKIDTTTDLNNKEIQLTKQRKENENQVQKLQLENEILKIDKLGLKEVTKTISGTKKENGLFYQIISLEQTLKKREQKIKSLEDEKKELKRQLPITDGIDYILNCNICGYKTTNHFLTSEKRSNAKCPKCGSLERDREIIYYLQNKVNITKSKFNIMIQSPSRVLYDYLNHNNIIYGVNSHKMYGVDHVMPLEKLVFGNNLFHYIISIHVLEYLKEDQKVLDEMYRVLMPGGKALIILPICNELKITIDQPDLINTEILQEKYYKNKKYLRCYGLDVENKIKKSGFIIKNKNYLKNISKEARKYNSLLPDILFECEKPKEAK